MPSTSELPDPVRQICAEWLSTIDTLAPGLVTGLWLRGGLGFGEWVPGQSDVDFVAALARRPRASDLAALRSSHERIGRAHPSIPFDGMHLLVEDLTRDPELCPDVPCVIHGLFEDEAREDLNPVAWQELAQGRGSVRGPGAETLGVWTEPERLLAFTRENLSTYWGDTADALRAMPREAQDPATCSWCVLGVARLHHLIRTGDLTTKSGAGQWALSHYPEHFHRVVREAVRVRSGGPDEYAEEPAQRGLDTAAFVAHAVAAGTGTGG